MRVFEKRANSRVKRWGLEFERELYVRVLDPLTGDLSNREHVLHSIKSNHWFRRTLRLPFVQAPTLYARMQQDDTFLQRNTSILDQIMRILLWFRSLGITHHDLHLNNILVVAHPIMEALYDIAPVTLCRPYHVLVIDFDHATKIPSPCNAIRIQNKSLDKQWHRLGEYNQPTSGFDWFTFLCGMCTTYAQGGKHALEYMGLVHVRTFFATLSLVYPGRPMWAQSHTPVHFARYLDDLADVYARVSRTKVHCRIRALAILAQHRAISPVIPK